MPHILHSHRTHSVRFFLWLDPPDLLIQPHLGHIKFMEFNRAQEAIDAGYKETMRKAGKMIAKQ
jgi:predicted acylesterase/phospholipase RssA